MSDVIPYLKHYTAFPDVALFWLLSFGVLFVILFLFSVYAKLSAKKNASADECISVTDDAAAHTAMTMDDPACRRFIVLSQKFFELIFSGTSILFFITVYYLVDRFYDYAPIKSVLVRYESFFLLLLIILSCLLNSFLDRVFVRLSFLRNEDRSAIRIIGMLYMFFIFGYVKYIYENNNYDYFISYFLGLMIGRFVYFDASWKDFAQAIKKALSNFPVMLFGLAATGAMAWVGFVKTGYLIKHIGVITNVFICHLFMCLSIFLLYHLHIENWLFKKKT